MGLLDDYSGQGGLLGVGMTPAPTRTHQRIAKKLLFLLTDKLPPDYEVLIFDAIEQFNTKSKVPDLTVYKNDIPLIFIEITTRDEFHKVIAKAKQVMDKNKVYEAFIYDYESKKTTKLSGIENHSVQNNYSDVLHILIKFDN